MSEKRLQKIGLGLKHEQEMSDFKRFSNNSNTTMLNRLEEKYNKIIKKEVQDAEQRVSDYYRNKLIDVFSDYDFVSWKAVLQVFDKSEKDKFIFESLAYTSGFIVDEIVLQENKNLRAKIKRLENRLQKIGLGLKHQPKNNRALELLDEWAKSYSAWKDFQEYKETLHFVIDEKREWINEKVKKIHIEDLERFAGLCAEKEAEAVSQAREEGYLKGVADKDNIFRKGFKDGYDKAVGEERKRVVGLIRKNCPVIYKAKGKLKEYGVTEEELERVLGREE